MNQKIISFRTDEEGHWVAILECGHRQHMRHDPPLVVRAWVLEETGRESHLGTELNCLLCEEGREEGREQERRDRKN